MNIKDYLQLKSKQLILKGNYWLGHYDHVIWLIGDGRSGTTWLSALINWNKRFREMFEPFHPKMVREMKSLPPHLYIRPNDINNSLYDIASRIFSGNFVHPRVDEANNNLLYSGLLIKDIFANLFAFWIANNFSKTKIIMLIRNPFAVALSKYKKKDWFWMTNPEDLLNQSALFEDYLHPYEDLIRDSGDDYIERQIIIWSIIHYVPLLQFKQGQICIAFYENIYNNPENELKVIFDFIKSGTNDHLDNKDWSEILNRPSRYSRTESNILKGKSPITSWKNELSARQIDNGYRILSRFGLEHLYDDNSNPQRAVLDNLISQSSS
jgi:hypothetical protein